jgi:hypothetical protein
VTRFTSCGPGFWAGSEIFDATQHLPVKSLFRLRLPMIHCKNNLLIVLIWIPLCSIIPGNAVIAFT